MSHISTKIRGLTAEEIYAVSGGADDEMLEEILVVGGKGNDNQTWFFEQNNAPDLMCTYDADAGSISCVATEADLAVNQPPPPENKVNEAICELTLEGAAVVTGMATDNDWVGLGSMAIIKGVQVFYCD